MLLAESPQCLRKIAVRFVCLIFATVVCLGNNLCFWDISGRDYAAYSKVFYNSKTEIKEKTEYETAVQETQLRLWQISLNKRYTNAKIKFIKKGAAHIQLTKYINGKPLKINVIEINSKINPDIKTIPATAGNKLAKKAAILNISQNNNAFAAVNGSYFKPQTGVPLGILMINKEILTGPIYDRAALGIFDDGYKIDRVFLNANVEFAGKKLQVQNVNQPRTLSTDVLVYTPVWGISSPNAPKYGINIAVKNGEIIQKSYSTIEIPENGFVISAPEKKVNEFFTENTKNKKLFLKHQKEKILLDLKINPDWENVNHIIGGGPLLVKDGKIFVDYAEEKLKSIIGRNPRTAAGYTKDGKLILVTIDGREESSVGAGLFELAGIMKSFECEYAMNLDGGGSSVMQIDGKIVNSPSVKGGIAVSNALVLTCSDTTITYAK